MPPRLSLFTPPDPVSLGFRTLFVIAVLLATATLRADPRSKGHLSGNEVSQRIIEARRQHEAIFETDPGGKALRYWEMKRENLSEVRNLDLGFAYTSIAQLADTSLRGPRSASGGDLDLYGQFRARPDNLPWKFALNFEAEWRHRYGQIPPADLNTGTLGGTIVDYGQQDPALIQLYAEAGSIEDRFLLRIGKLDPADFFNIGRYVTPEDGFLSPAFSDSLPMALPDNGFGIVGNLYVTPDVFIELGIHDANARRAGGISSFADEGEYFTAAEIGWNPGFGSTSEGLYNATVWHVDARPKAGKESDWGIALNLEQEIGPGGHVLPFLRYSWADTGLNDVKQSLSLGVGFENIFGHADDDIGIAGSWMQPRDRMLRDQYVFEGFYRIFITPHIHITPDIQFIFDPSNAPQKNMVTVAGIRLRTIF